LAELTAPLPYRSSSTIIKSFRKNTPPQWIMEYKIVICIQPTKQKDSRGKSVEEMVQKLLDVGWRCQGGVSVGGAGGASIHFWYCQAMVKD